MCPSLLQKVCEIFQNNDLKIEIFCNCHGGSKSLGIQAPASLQWLSPSETGSMSPTNTLERQTQPNKARAERSC